MACSQLQPWLQRRANLGQRRVPESFPIGEVASQSWIKDGEWELETIACKWNRHADCHAALCCRKKVCFPPSKKCTDTRYMHGFAHTSVYENSLPDIFHSEAQDTSVDAVNAAKFAPILRCTLGYDTKIASTRLTICVYMYAHADSCACNFHSV